MKWIVKMSEFGVGYDPRNAIKDQALVEVIQEMTINKTTDKKWLMYIDGSSTVGGSGVGIILVNQEGDQFK